MVNEQIHKVAKYICALNPTIDAAAYADLFLSKKTALKHMELPSATGLQILLCL